MTASAVLPGRPWRTMRVLLMALLASAVVAPVVPAQQPSGLDGLVNAEERLPVTFSSVLEIKLWGVASGGGVPAVLEEDEPEVRRQVGRPKIAVYPSYFNGKSVREAMDALVEDHPRYMWRYDRGVIVVRPIVNWRGRTNVLGTTIRDVRFDNASPRDVLIQLRRLVFAEGRGPESVFPLQESRRFSVHVAAGTVLNLLIETARAHGGLFWTIPGEKARLPGRDPVDFAVEYKTFDGDAFSLGRFLEKP